MRKLKKFFKVGVLVLILSMVSPTVLPISSVAVAQAATIKLSKKDLTLEIGKSATLKVTGTKQTVTWTTSKKTVATVSKLGKVIAIKAGTATITATVNKKKYTCQVTVKEAIVANPYLKDAPFEAQEVTTSAINYVIPKDWVKAVITEQGNNAQVVFYPTSADTTKDFSFVQLIIQETGVVKPDYSITKEIFEEKVTKELITSQLAQSGLLVTLSDFKTSDYEAKLGTAFKIEYKAANDSGSMTQVIYDLYIDNYLIQVTITDIGDNMTPNVSAVGEYLLNSIQVTK